MILYEDRDILVCHKAAGIPVQSAGVGTKDLVSQLMNYLSEKQQGMPYLGLVHRLDQPVEGILVFAKNKKAAAELSRQVTDGSMQKVYLAVCCEDGTEAKSLNQQKKTVSQDELQKVRQSLQDNPDENFAGQTYHLTDCLKKDARTNTSSIVPEHTPGAKKSELLYQVLKETEAGQKQYALVRVRLLSGRHHQIRVQMAGAGMPLYGDRKYNPVWESFRQQDCEQGAGTQLALCAASLSFDHPTKKKRRMEFEVQPSAGIFALFNK
jgi:23S rRNA pseudouridine1911/1915/1917 synthase